MRKKLLKINICISIFLILSGLFLQYKEPLLGLLSENKLNLNLSEIDTYYDNDSSIDFISYNSSNQSWYWPTTTNYSITSQFSKNHPGIDIVPNDNNLEVYASYSGTIVTNSYKWDGGNYLVLQQDNGYYSLYCHLSQKLVNVGDHIEKGQVIGIMGRTGYATGVHLHYSVWMGYPYQGGTPINPFGFY